MFSVGEQPRMSLAAFRLDGERFVPVECPQAVPDPVVCAAVPTAK